MKNESNYAMRATGRFDADSFTLIAGVIEDGVNSVPCARAELVSRDRLLDLNTFVGEEMAIEITGEKKKSQYFCGVCVSAEYLGSSSGDGHYLTEIRPWIWFLSRQRDSRIFQEMKTIDIVKEVLGDHGFSGFIKDQIYAPCVAREYCVQYRETDLNFIMRLLEEDGIYFFFEYKDGTATMILADSVNSHSPVEIDDKIPFRDDEAEQQLDHFYKWDSVENVVRGKVTLDDYNFEKPKADLTAVSTIPKGSHSHKDYEVYDYPGLYSEVGRGEDSASIQMEAYGTDYRKWTAEGNVLNLGVGRTFTLEEHPRHGASSVDFFITKFRQVFRLESGENYVTRPRILDREHFDLSEFEHTHVKCDVVEKLPAFRMPEITPKPEISGIQTAVVTGPSGEEIHTDKYGRIKVKFHWDRSKSPDDKSSCWVRAMMPAAGKNWGTIAIPRIGQEVVIQFEEGNPDRPLCTGVVYNADNMPPYPLPANATRMGMKTNASKGGSGFSELMFEDKKGNELVRFQSERDYVQTIQNSAHVKVGYDYEADCKKADADGDKSMKIEIENNLEEIIEKGDHTFSVKAGEQTISVKKDKTETIEGKSTQTITGNVTETVKQGNYSLDTKVGKIDLTAMQSITLKVGPSSIKIDMSGVTIKGPMIKVEGTAMVEAKAPMTQVKGDAMLILKGGLTTIN